MEKKKLYRQTSEQNLTSPNQLYIRDETGPQNKYKTIEKIAIVTYILINYLKHKRNKCSN